MTLQDVDKSFNAETAGGAVVRPSREADVPAMLAIYLHHIRHGVDPDAAGDIETPDADDLRRRRKTMHRGRLPHLVAERAGVVVAYAYAVPFRKRPAYRYAVKHSIYVHHEHLGRGVGRLLAAGADRRLRRRGLPPDDRLHRRGQPGLAAPPRIPRLPRGRPPAVDRLQVRPLDRFGDGAALARARGDGAAGGVTRFAVG